MRAGPSVPTSDFKSSDLAPAESLLFIGSCRSSSLLVDGVLPLDTVPTAGGAAATKSKKCVSGRQEVQLLTSTRAVEPPGQGEVVLRSNLITWPGVSGLSELSALLQQQSELFNTPILRNTEAEAEGHQNPIKMFI